MKGEPVNIENIGNTIKEEFESLKKKVDKVDGKGAATKVQNGFLRVIEGLGNALYYFFKFIGKILAFLLLLTCLFLVMVLLFASFSEPTNFQINDISIQAFSWIELGQLFNSSTQMTWITLISSLLFIIIPIISLLFFSLKILFNFKLKSSYFYGSLLTIWIVSVLGLFVGLTFTAVNFSSSQQVEERFELINLKSDTIILKCNNDNKWLNKMGILLEDDQILTNDLSLTVVQSTDSISKLNAIKTARGKNKISAKYISEAINIEFEATDNALIVSPYISTEKVNGYRFQTVEIQLELPVGKTVFLDHSVKNSIFDIQNIGDVLDKDMMMHHWLMTPDGLICTDCKFP